jgi:phosphatidylglycerophosphate synthase
MEKPARRKFRQETVIHSYIVRPLAFEIIRLLWNTSITPNQITLFRVVLNIAAVIFFFMSEHIYFLLGFILFQVHEIIDHADGLYARMKGLTSKMGVFLEHFFDAIFSANYNLLGLAISYSAYSLTNSIVFIYMFIALMIANNLTQHYKKQFKGEAPAIFDVKDKSEGKREGMINLDHEKEELLSIFNQPFKVAIKNTFITAYIWQNQFMLWGAVLYFPLINYFNTILVGLSICLILNYMAVLYWSYFGLSQAILIDQNKPK